ncbi:MAG: aldehyde ferredoxin oxidoreductase [Syntrophobacteraceae bacterium CG2_30_61_12]|nr:MAG: aldehyde ferredoxin oxidoreductase [Syntrophobacteraceae bacterium CG2_30_61_12]
MMRDFFRVLVVDLATGKGEPVNLEGRATHLGGSGLAALLFERYGDVRKPWNDPEQPLIFAIGPLTGAFPLMSKTVCGFLSPYHNQYAESHAGGRSALALRFADLDALVLRGRAPHPAFLTVASRHLKLGDASYLWGLEVDDAGKLLRRISPGSGHRGILRIGPAGETGSAMAGINVDTYRHFGRLGAGAVMGAKRLKALVIHGDAAFDLPSSSDYPKLFQKIHQQVTATPMMDKYHHLGTPANVAVLNQLQALPVRNLQATHDPAAAGISGERFAEQALLRNMACSGCPLGCIHVGFIREPFLEPDHYLYRQVAYDHEPIFAVGSMLGVTDPFQVLAIIDAAERQGLDVMAAGVALAWATEASATGLISEAETLLPLQFGAAAGYRQAMGHLGRGRNDFYRLLAQGTLGAADQYGGRDFACVLGQEMAGYATGEVFFISQALGFRHSHLDTGGYAYDQQAHPKDAVAAVDFLIQDEQERVLLTSLVSCLFARAVYNRELTVACLSALGYGEAAANLDRIAAGIQAERWRLRLAGGFDPRQVPIPKRFTEVVTGKGRIDPDYLAALQREYSRRIGAWSAMESETETGA